MLKGIQRSLERGESVVLPGFGSFAVAERAARTMRNPATGEPLDVPATRRVACRVGKNLKEAVK